MYILPTGLWILLSHLSNITMINFQKPHPFYVGIVDLLSQIYIACVRVNRFIMLFVYNLMLFYSEWQMNYIPQLSLLMSLNLNTIMKKLNTKPNHGLNREK